MGISPEFLPHVFEIFAQAPQGLARTKGGLGIGLTLVRAILEEHGGSIHAYSAGIGCGSEFTVRLPRAFPGQLAWAGNGLQALRSRYDGPESADALGSVTVN
jgi:signal transduction histidine kinase